MSLWYNTKLNKLITTLDFGHGLFLLSKDSYTFNGKSYTILDIYNMGYERIGNV